MRKTQHRVHSVWVLRGKATEMSSTPRNSTAGPRQWCRQPASWKWTWNGELFEKCPPVSEEKGKCRMGGEGGCKCPVMALNLGMTMPRTVSPLGSLIITDLSNTWKPSAILATPGSEEASRSWELGELREIQDRCPLFRDADSGVQEV